MKEIFEKLSSYNIFNYLFPGVLFVVIAKHTTIYDFVQSDIILGFFSYYFIGLVISRVGSLFIEWFLKKIKFVKYCDHKDYATAEKQDEKVKLLQEINNMYRTLISMGLLLLLLKLYEFLSVKFQFCDTVTQIALLVFVLILFLLSFRKQTKYVVKQVSYKLKDKKNETSNI
jgi:C4-dicarboxylate transporter